MEKKSKSNKSEAITDGQLKVKVNGEDFTTIYIKEIKNVMSRLATSVQRGNYCNENQNVPTDGAIARFDNLKNEQKKNFGINANDQLETIARIIDEVCGDEFFLPI